MSIRSCNAVKRRHEDEPQWFAVLALAADCTLRGRWDGPTFIAETGGQCILPFAGRRKRFTITDAVVRRTPLGYRPERVLPHLVDDNLVVDDSYVEVELGGELAVAAGPGQHVQFHFTGTLRDVTDATTRVPRRAASAGLTARAPRAREGPRPALQ